MPHPALGSPVAPAAPPLDWWARMQRLMHDQCWCWGRDIERPEGNLLLLRGGTRVPTPAGRTFAYRLLEARRNMLLAGGGMCYGRSERGSAIIYGRYELRPRLLTLRGDEDARWPGIGPPVFSTEGTPSEAPEALTLLGEAIDWIAAYEAWVHDIAGPEHRRGCLERWPHASTPDGDLERAWRELRLDLPLAVEGASR